MPGHLDDTIRYDTNSYSNWQIWVFEYEYTRPGPDTIRFDTILIGSDVAPYYTILHDTTRYDAIRHDTIRYDTMICKWLYQLDSIRCDTMRYDTIRYDTTRYDTTRHDTTRCNKSLIFKISGAMRYDTIRYDTIRYFVLSYWLNH